MIARQAIDIDGRTVEPGEYFETPVVQAVRLSATHKARIVKRRKVAHAPAIEPKPKRTYRRKDVTAETSTDTPAERPKRTYKRRDLTAES